MQARAFTEQSPQSPQELFNFNQFAEATRQELAHLGKEPQPIIRALYQEYKANQTYYDNVFKNPKLAKQLQSALKEQLSSIDDMAINTQFGLLGVLALMVAPVGAQQASSFFKSHTGAPPGGKDLCEGTLFEFGCAQGYTTQGDAPFQLGVDSQFMRSLKEIGQKPDSASREQLRTCFTPETMGVNVTNIRNRPNASTTLQSCPTSSLPWNGYSIDTITTNVPTDQCAILKDEIDASIQACKSTVGAILKGAEIAGIVLGGAAGLALIIGGAYLTYKQCCKVSDKNNATGGDIEEQRFNPGYGR